MPKPPAPLSILNDVFTQLASLQALPLTPKLPDTARPYLLTLHVLFPHLLLPALDLLDRGLVTRLILDTQSHSSSDAAPESHGRETDASEDREGAVRVVVGYDVTSASSVHSSNRFASRRSEERYGDDEDGSGGGVIAGRTYQVTLDGWHCSCPAFAFAAFGNGNSTTTTIVTPQNDQVRASMNESEHDQDDQSHEMRPQHRNLGLCFGGLTCIPRSRSKEKTLPPVCKHLLAVMLGEWCGSIFQDQSNAARGMRERIMTLDEVAGWAAGSGL